MGNYQSSRALFSKVTKTHVELNTIYQSSRALFTKVTKTHVLYSFDVTKIHVDLIKPYEVHFN